MRDSNGDCRIYETAETFQQIAARRHDEAGLPNSDLVDAQLAECLVAWRSSRRRSPSQPILSPDFAFEVFRRRTPGPPPFSSMNSTPERFKTSLINLKVQHRSVVMPQCS
jgi:hypothetical protein